MQTYKKHFLMLSISIFLIGFQGCKKDNSSTPTPVDASISFTVNGVYNGTLSYKGLDLIPKIVVNFTEAIKSTEVNNIIFKIENGANLNSISKLFNQNKTLEISPTNPLSSFTNYQLIIPVSLVTETGGKIINPLSINLQTGFDDTDKFPRISDDELLTLIQRQTLKYFYDFGHPISGMARERNTSGDIVTTGGTGFGIMGMVVGVHRNFISKTDALTRIQKIVTFLKTADKFHGAFPHWINGNTGKVQPFSAKDNGADLVETSFLMEGLLVARQYFNGSNAAELSLRTDINQLYQNVEWSWFRKNNEERLLWHWSPEFNWDINLQVKGWNESLMTYVLAASSSNYSIPKSVYDNGWAGNGSMKNGNSFYGVNLPLGPNNGGPLFFEHYSLMALNPIGLTDVYANYETQAKAHSLINYNYCVANPKSYVGYSENCWGLTASDIKNGYTASSPTNDLGYIAPTAAISSIPYTTQESLKASRFFYYTLGDKVWGEYGFKDAFSLNDPWFAHSYLAIDQGPQIVMIENYRTGLIWNLFMSCPEVKTGLTKLGFQSPKI